MNSYCFLTDLLLTIVKEEKYYFLTKLLIFSQNI